MKKLILLTLSLVTLISCSDNANVKKSSDNETPEVKQEQPVKPKREEPVAKTITLKEVSRIALVEAEQFITNAKNNGLDYSNISTIFENAKTAYANKDYKKAQKLAVSVRQKIEELLSND